MSNGISLDMFDKNVNIFNKNGNAWASSLQLSKDNLQMLNLAYKKKNHHLQKQSKPQYRAQILDTSTLLSEPLKILSNSTDLQILAF